MTMNGLLGLKLCESKDNAAFTLVAFLLDPLLVKKKITEGNL